MRVFTYVGSEASWSNLWVVSHCHCEAVGGLVKRPVSLTCGLSVTVTVRLWVGWLQRPVGLTCGLSVTVTVRLWVGWCQRPVGLTCGLSVTVTVRLWVGWFRGQLV